MKRLIWGIISVLVCSCAGCGTKQDGEVALRELTRAENVMFDYPDSALHILQAMPVPAGKEQHALWCLLTTQAAYKQFLPIPSDSLIRIAYDYYRNTDDIRRKAMAALYMGGVNYDLGRADEAIQYYLEAKTEVEKTDDYKLGYLVMSGLGRLYLYRELASYSIDACKQAYHYAVKDSCKRYEMTSLHYIARSYCLLDSLDKAIKCYEQCSKMALELHLPDFNNSIRKEIALVYMNKGSFQTALAMLKSLPLSSQTADMIGRSYLNLHELDSAYIYLNKALKTDNVYTRRSVYNSLYKLSCYPEYQKLMRESCDSLLLYQDSVSKINKVKEVIAYKEKYEYQKLVNENQRLELEKARMTKYLLFAVVIILLLVIVVVGLHLRKHVLLRKKEKELNKLTVLLCENEKIINRNVSYIAELHEQIRLSYKKESLLDEQLKLLSELQNENERLSLENNQLHDKLKSISSNSSELVNIEFVLEKLRQVELREAKLLTQNPLIHELHQKPIYLENSALKNLCRITDDIYNGFSIRLSSIAPSLKEQDIILCCLIKLHFSISEIGTFLNIASTSVSRNKLRVKNKIYHDLGLFSCKKSLDIWIWEF